MQRRDGIAGASDGSNTGKGGSVFGLAGGLLRARPMPDFLESRPRISAPLRAETGESGGHDGRESQKSRPGGSAACAGGDGASCRFRVVPEDVLFECIAEDDAVDLVVVRVAEVGFGALGVGPRLSNSSCELWSSRSVRRSSGIFGPGRPVQIRSWVAFG